MTQKCVCVCSIDLYQMNMVEKCHVSECLTGLGPLFLLFLLFRLDAEVPLLLLSPFLSFYSRRSPEKGNPI